MSAESDLYAALITVPAVASNVWPDDVPLGKGLPAVAYERIATEDQYTIHGTKYASIVTFSVTCQQKIREQAIIIGDAVQAALETANITVIDRQASSDYDRETEAEILTVEYFHCPS